MQAKLQEGDFIIQVSPVAADDAEEQFIQDAGIDYTYFQIADCLLIPFVPFLMEMTVVEDDVERQWAGALLGELALKVPANQNISSSSYI